MRILCVKPPEYGYMEWVGKSFNSSTYRIASYLRKQGHTVEVCDLRPELLADYRSDLKHDGSGYFCQGIHVTTNVGNRACGNWEAERRSRPMFRIGFSNNVLIEHLKAFKPDVVAISCMFTYTWEGARDVVMITREHSNAEIWLGGIYAQLCADHAMKNVRPDKINLDCDVFTPIDLSLFKTKPFALDILTRVGCPNSCGYCAVHLLEGHKIRHRDPMEVVEEIENAYNEGIKLIRFLDSNILLGFEGHFKVILKEILRRRIKVELMIYGGVDQNFLTPENWDLMYRAGMIEMNVPIESVSEKLLKQWGRKSTTNEWLAKIREIKKLGYPIKSYMMAGCYNQTAEDIHETIDFLLAEGVKPDILFYTPIPGTREFKEQGRPLEDLHPLLYPLANSEMTVQDLEDIRHVYCREVEGCMVTHPMRSEKPKVREDCYALI